MSVLRALYETYNTALRANLVDRTEDIGQKTVLLPVYHSNKRSNGNDIIQITLTACGDFIKAEWVPKDEYIIYPVTEQSIIRSSGIAPHPLCDELSYLSKEINPEKHEKYLQEIDSWKEFMQQGQINPTFEAITNYIYKETILGDVIRGILGNTSYHIDETYVVHYHAENQKEKQWKLEKIFVTFLVENLNALQKNNSVTSDQQLHINYIDYIRYINKNKPKKYCNISKELTYCATLHRGIMGNAKIISISNHNETYYGRFSTGEEVVCIGYEASQKIHLMLKYFLENKNNSRWLGETSYLINWFSDDIENNEGLQLTNTISTYEDTDSDLEDDEEMVSLGGQPSKALNDYLTGRESMISPDSKFYVMIIDKINNGRVSIKYFREIAKSDLYQRVKGWYESTRWSYFNPKLKKYMQQSPSIYRLTDYIMGMEIEEKKTTKVSCKNKSLRAKTVERLIPCILEGKRIPIDLVRKMYYNLCKRSSYGDTWNSLVQVGCSIFKKYKIDYQMKDEVNELLEEKNQDRSYLYGRLLAVYEKLEADVLETGSKKGDDGKQFKDSGNRSTNAERLWTVYTKTPARTLMILEDRIRPYKERLLKNKPSSHIYYERLIGSLVNNLAENASFEDEKNNPLDENFIFGYYAQKQDFYRKRNEVKEEEFAVEYIMEV